jgi:LuxR family maltose regulon positive regulatory protein
VDRPGRRPAATDIVVILDDYHVIENPVIHESLASFVEQATAHVHIAMTTRSDPPLPLARLRARGQLLEVRAAQLRFSDDEGSALFNEVLSIGLSSH